MRLIHISDLHFGTEIPELVASLRAHIKATPADMVIVSGDMTQVASHDEFTRAQDFLHSLGMPLFCIPGNHDIPRFNFWQRLTDPLGRYQRYFGAELTPVWQQGPVCIAGINTARPILPHWNWAHGAVSAQQLKQLARIYDNAHDRVRVCVMHHPLQTTMDHHFKNIVYGRARAIDALARMRVDLVLTGHVHHAAATFMDFEDHRTVFLGASTALSRRIRRSANGYNVIDIDAAEINMHIYSFQQQKFDLLETITHPLHRASL
ncbi:MAG TPA: metallophosphoesterase [Micavibrio sp.]